MINLEIYEGLKNALASGASLRESMQSFYNAGYRKEEIEEAARELIKQPLPVSRGSPRPIIPLTTQGKVRRHIRTPFRKIIQTLPISQAIPEPQIKFVPNPIKQSQQNAEQEAKITRLQPEPTKVPSKKIVAVKKVSSYEKHPEAKSIVILIILIIILVILIGFLAGIFLFKEELVEFFHNLFAK